MHSVYVRDTFLNVASEPDNEEDALVDKQPSVQRSSTTTDLRIYRADAPASVPEYVGDGTGWRKLMEEEDFLACRRTGHILTIVSEASTEEGVSGLSAGDSPRGVRSRFASGLSSLDGAEAEQGWPAAREEQGVGQARLQQDEPATVKGVSVGGGSQRAAEAEAKASRPQLRRSWTSATDDGEGPWGALAGTAEEPAGPDTLPRGAAGGAPELPPPPPRQEQQPSRAPDRGPAPHRQGPEAAQRPRHRREPEGGLSAAASPLAGPAALDAEAKAAMASWAAMQPALMAAAMAQANCMAGYPTVPGYFGFPMPPLVPGAWPLMAPFTPWPSALTPYTPGPAAMHSMPIAEAKSAAEGNTTVMMRNLPNNYTRSMLLELLDEEGFSGRYDFIYVPHDFNTGAGLGFAFVNLLSPADALNLRSRFEGFRRWAIPSSKVCAVGWSGPDQQGLAANVERYRNSSVMHESVPEDCRPIVFANGQPTDFPKNTRKLWPPDASHGARSRKA